MLMGRGLSISPTVLFLRGFHLLGVVAGLAPGAFFGCAAHDLPDLHAPRRSLKTRWLANVMGMGGPEPEVP